MMIMNRWYLPLHDTLVTPDDQVKVVVPEELLGDIRPPHDGDTPGVVRAPILLLWVRPEQVTQNTFVGSHLFTLQIS